MLDCRQALASPPPVSWRVLRAALAVAALVGAAGPAAQDSLVAETHLIDLASAERALRQTVRGYASRAAAAFSETRSFGTRSEETVGCRRVAEHRAACSWRALVYLLGDEPGAESLWLVCTGRAGVQVQGRRLRVDLRGAGCAH